MSTTDFGTTPENGDDVVTRLSVEWLLRQVTEEERMILELWLIDELTFDEIGIIVGLKYRGRVLAGRTMQYHKDKIRARLREFAPQMGYESVK